MTNEIANRSHAGLVLQTFEDEDADPVAVAAWGVDLSTLQRLAAGVYAVRLTQGLSLSLDPDDPRQARFDFLVLAQGIALPNFAQGFVQPDPFGAPGDFTPGAANSIQFPWISVVTTTPANNPEDVDAVLNIEVRRIPRRGL